MVERAFQGLNIRNWDTPSHPGRFTPREILAHLADWEPIWLARMRLCVDSSGADIVPYDEGKRAIDLNYQRLDPIESLQAFKDSRASTIKWLDSLTEQDWQKHANHPEQGRLTVYDIANTMVCHDVYHVAQLQEASLDRM